MGLGRLGTEVAPEIVTKIQEVFTPNLNDSVSILGTISWIDGGHMQLVVVPVRHAGGCVIEVASQTHSEGNDFCKILDW